MTPSPLRKIAARAGREPCPARTRCAPGQIRTADTRFRRAVLYPLSYRRAGRSRSGPGTRASLPGAPADARTATVRPNRYDPGGAGRVFHPLDARPRPAEPPQARNSGSRSGGTRAVAPCSRSHHPGAVPDDHVRLHSRRQRCQAARAAGDDQPAARRFPPSRIDGAPRPTTLVPRPQPVAPGRGVHARAGRRPVHRLPDQPLTGPAASRRPARS